MCQHSWYDKNRRHYGPKPNTRRERGLPRRDLGIKRGPRDTRWQNEKGLPEIDIDRNVRPVPIPKEFVLKRYVKIYNWYVRYCDKFRDENVAIEHVMQKFSISRFTTNRAIRTIKYVLVLTADEH